MSQPACNMQTVTMGSPWTCTTGLAVAPPAHPALTPPFFWLHLQDLCSQRLGWAPQGISLHRLLPQVRWAHAVAGVPDSCFFPTCRGAFPPLNGFIWMCGATETL